MAAAKDRWQYWAQLPHRALVFPAASDIVPHPQNAPPIVRHSSPLARRRHGFGERPSVRPAAARLLDPTAERSLYAAEGGHRGGARDARWRWGRKGIPAQPAQVARWAGDF